MYVMCVCVYVRAYNMHMFTLHVSASVAMFVGVLITPHACAKGKVIGFVCCHLLSA